MVNSNKVRPQEWGGELLSGFSSTLWEKQGMEYHLEVLQRKLLAKGKESNNLLQIWEPKFCMREFQVLEAHVIAPLCVAICNEWNDRLSLRNLWFVLREDDEFGKQCEGRCRHIPVSRMLLSQKPFEEATLLFKSLKNALLFRRKHFLKNKSFCFRKH